MALKVNAVPAVNDWSGIDAHPTGKHPFAVLLPNETAKVPAVHCAYNVRFAYKVTVAPAAYAVPLPAARVFQPAKVYPVRVNVFALSALAVPATIGSLLIVPLAPLALKVIA